MSTTDDIMALAAAMLKAGPNYDGTITELRTAITALVAERDALKTQIETPPEWHSGLKEFGLEAPTPRAFAERMYARWSSRLDAITAERDALRAALAAQPVAWTDDQMDRFAWTCINPPLGADSIRERLHSFSEAEKVRGNAVPPAQPVAGWVCAKCGTDRCKATCPLGCSAALTGQCPMTGTAAEQPQQATPALRDQHKVFAVWWLAQPMSIYHEPPENIAWAAWKIASAQAAQQAAQPVAEVHAAHLHPAEDGGHWCREVLLYSGGNPGDQSANGQRVKLYAAAQPQQATEARESLGWSAADESSFKEQR